MLIDCAAERGSRYYWQILLDKEMLLDCAADIVWKSYYTEILAERESRYFWEILLDRESAAELLRKASRQRNAARLCS